MSSKATPEGIATNGNDIWIVDSKSDKVYKYAGAASRLSGSQNAVSSFSLNSGNKDAKDIVTDGSSLWVVNDSSIDKVFKYTVAGSLLGSWTIGSANSKPTGLTIDPANVSDVWIVDNGTDRVYQYIGAASRTSGSQNAAATFSLASGNSNPQGIADPPPQSDRQLRSSVSAGLPSIQLANLFADHEFDSTSHSRAVFKLDANANSSWSGRQQAFESYLLPRSNEVVDVPPHMSSPVDKSDRAGTIGSGSSELAAMNLAFEAAFASIN